MSVTDQTIGEYGEDALIQILLARCPIKPIPFGPGDDAALMSSHGRRVITTDALVEGTHFLRAHPPRALGWKAAAVNLSDVAAMGAIPEAFLLTLYALPVHMFHRWRAVSLPETKEPAVIPTMDRATVSALGDLAVEGVRRLGKGGSLRDVAGTIARVARRRPGETAVALLAVASGVVPPEDRARRDDAP